MLECVTFQNDTVWRLCFHRALITMVVSAVATPRFWKRRARPCALRRSEPTSIRGKAEAFKLDGYSKVHGVLYGTCRPVAGNDPSTSASRDIRRVLCLSGPRSKNRQRPSPPTTRVAFGLSLASRQATTETTAPRGFGYSTQHCARV